MPHRKDLLIIGYLSKGYYDSYEEALPDKKELEKKGMRVQIIPVDNKFEIYAKKMKYPKW